MNIISSWKSPGRNPNLPRLNFHVNRMHFLWLLIAISCLMGLRDSTPSCCTMVCTRNSDCESDNGELGQSKQSVTQSVTHSSPAIHSDTRPLFLFSFRPNQKIKSTVADGFLYPTQPDGQTGTSSFSTFPLSANTRMPSKTKITHLSKFDISTSSFSTCPLSANTQSPLKTKIFHLPKFK